MDTERLGKLHDILVKPWYRRILLELNQHEGLTLDALAIVLKVADVGELRRELMGLEHVTFEDQLLISNSNGYYLTDTGHYVLGEMLAFPELESDEYKQKWGDEKDKQPAKPMPKWWKPYWIVLFAFVIISLVIIDPIFFHSSLDTAAILWLFFGLSALGFSYCVRLHPPSERTNRLLYIFFVGTFIGSLLMIASAMMFGKNSDLVSMIVISMGCIFVGWVLGDLVGKALDYRGPAQYSP